MHSTQFSLCRRLVCLTFPVLVPEVLEPPIALLIFSGLAMAVVVVIVVVFVTVSMEHLHPAAEHDGIRSLGYGESGPVAQMQQQPLTLRNARLVSH